MIKENYIFTAKNYILKRKLFFSFAFIGFGLVTSSFLSINSHNQISGEQKQSSEKKQIRGLAISITQQPTQSTIENANQQIITNTTIYPTRIVTVAVTPTPTQKINSTQANNNQTSLSATNTPTQSTSQPTITPTPTTAVLGTTIQPTPTSNPSPTQASDSVTVQINEPDGNTNASVKLNSGANTCDVLTEAKNEEKVKSLTLDDSYMSSFHSMYVKEMNGYQNNWTFSVNDTSPQGCSLYSPKNGDVITWKFN